MNLSKLYIITATCILLLSFCIPAIAETKSVTVEWSIADTEGITGYRMYYAYTEAMTNKQLACEMGDLNVTSLTCQDVNITQYPVYFTIAAVMNQGEESSSLPEQIVGQASISIPLGFQIIQIQ